MTQDNRRRRAAKAKRHQQDRTRRRPDERPERPEHSARQAPPGTSELDAARAQLHEILVRSSAGRPTDWSAFERHPEDVQYQVVQALLSSLVGVAAAHGWTVTDLVEVGRRRMPAPAQALWRAVVADGADVRAWSDASGLGWSAACRLAIASAVVLLATPPLPGAPAGESTASAPAARNAMDERILRKVRGLLAKAESTEYEAEAATLTAKAQELMAKYAIEESLAQRGTSAATAPVLRRIWIDAPYTTPKATLVGAVAAANHCRCIDCPDWGFVSLVGHATDLDRVEVLATSLLVQATRAMTLAGPQYSRYGTTQTRSFRHAFLLAFAHRIGQRLHEATQHTEAAAAVQSAGALVPVLAARDAAVDAELDQLFPHLVSRPVRVSNGRGWGAGRAAADLASIDNRAGLERRGA